MGRKVNQDHKIRSLVLNRVVRWMFFVLNKDRVWRPWGIHLYPNFPWVALVHSSLYMYLRRFSIRAGGRRNSLAISCELAAYFSLEINYHSLNRVLMCCHWIIKPKFNDVCALFKHSNFSSRMLEMHSIHSNFSRNSRSQVTPLPWVCFLLHLLQSFCHLLKILSKTLILPNLFYIPFSRKNRPAPCWGF